MTKFPVIKVNDIMDIAGSQRELNLSINNRSNEPFILIRAVEIVYYDLDHVIGLPL